MASKRVVPWFGSEEWSAVYQELFSEDPKVQQHAVDRIAVWKCRQGNKLSFGIECSWQLVIAFLQDIKAKENGDTRSLDQQLRLTYSMAIARFVNHLTQKEQNRAYARPIHAIAGELGLPEWIVEMRHEATHAVLPSLPMLRIAAKACLTWIKHEYWDAQAMSNMSGDETNPGREELAMKQLADQLVVYMEEQFNEVSGGAAKNETVMVEIIRLISKCRERAANILTNDGYMIPTAEQLNAFNIRAEELMAKEGLDLPEELVELWWPVLANYRQFLQSLLFGLARELSDKGQLKDRLCAGWLAFLVTANAMAGKSGIFRQTVKIAGMRLLKMTLQNPNRYTAPLIQCYFQHLDLPLTEQQKYLLIKLLESYSETECSLPSEAETTQPDRPYTLKSLLQLNKDDLEHSESQSEAWKLCQDLVDWRDYPLGTCQGATLSHTSLELDPSVDNIECGKSKTCVNTKENITGSLDDDLSSEVTYKHETDVLYNITGKIELL